MLLEYSVSIKFTLTYEAVLIRGPAELLLKIAIALY